MKMENEYGNLSTEVFTEREKNRLIELGWHEVVPKKETITPKTTTEKKTTAKKTTTKGVKNGKEN